DGPETDGDTVEKGMRRKTVASWEKNNTLLQKVGDRSTMQSSSSMGKGMSFGSPRKLAVLGVVVFFVGFALGGVGNQVSGALVVLPFADTITALGFVLAVSAAVRAR